MPVQWLALDIGGANLKAADGRGYAASKPFPLWAKPELLAYELRAMIAEAPETDHLAVTMTGELADCFESKTAGVQFILKAVEEASDRRHTRVYLANGKLVAPAVARREPLSAAASNWRALAEFAVRYAADQPTLLIDVGSTTTDIIPLVAGRVAATGANDTQRLLSGELVYAGVVRTPVCALAEIVPYRNLNCPIARELFATTRDVYLILGDLREHEDDTNTADNRPATKVAARARLARMICAEGDDFNHRDAALISQTVAQKQFDLTKAAVLKVAAAMPQRPTQVLLAGEGEFLARRVVKQTFPEMKLLSMARSLGARVSRCAPAHALAVLARESMEPRPS
jgi:probable H4MPT-linked C1 transfer pathway protein